ncbi:hypothetical protein LTR85_006896 [Meristemomyces frigidus]|nr:hypothetical protein LTR85_006896 [Meristemomyces frigidus]
MSRFGDLAVVKELTPRTLALFFFMSIGAINFGFDNNWWNCALSLQEFADYYGPPSKDGGPKTLPSSWQSAGSGTANAGMVIGCLIAGAIGRRVGRRMSIVVLVGIALVGMIIQNAIHSFWAVMAGRMINAISMGIESNVMPMYMAELAPPAIRGSIVNFYQWWQMIGALLAVGIVFGSRHYGNEWSFRIVMLVQLIIPILLFCIVWILPESPRWLLMKDRREDAYKSLAFIRKGAATPMEVEQELDLLQEANFEQEHFHRATSYKDCIQGSNGRRTLIAASVQVLQQLQGNSFISSYGVIYLQQLGVTDALKAQVIFVSMSLAGASFAFYLADRVGRRPLFLSTAVLAWACIWFSAGLSSFWPGGVSGGPVAKGSLSCMLIWSCLTTLGWGSCVWITTSEVATAQLREKTISIATIFSFIAVLLVTYINPFVQNAPGNLGSKVGFVYGSFSVIAFVWVYFMVPELSGRSLEELDELFQSKVSARMFKSYQCSGVGAKITAIQDLNANAHAHILEGKGGGDSEVVSQENVNMDAKV